MTDYYGEDRSHVGAFLTNVWRDGALFGSTPQEAFYVRCDDETNPFDERELGKVTTEIGVAIVRPANRDLPCAAVGGSTAAVREEFHERFAMSMYTSVLDARNYIVPGVYLEEGFNQPRQDPFSEGFPVFIG